MEQQPTFHQPVGYVQLPYNGELPSSSNQQLQPQIVPSPSFNIVANSSKTTEKKAQSIKKTRPKGKNLIVPSSKLMFEHVHALVDGRYFCSICSSTYKTIATILAHIRQIHLRDESYCQEPGCHHHALTRSERARHQKKHDNEKDQERIAKRVEAYNKASDLKKSKFPSEEKVKEVFLQNNKDIAGMFKSMDPQKRKIVYTCETCSQNFHHSFHAAKHVEMHTKSPQKCYYCGDVRNGNLDVQTHYVKKHQNDAIRVYHCTICDKRFTSMLCHSKHLKYMNMMGCRPEHANQETYFGEIPESVIVDGLTQQRVDQNRRQNSDRNNKSDDPDYKMMPVSKTLVQTANGMKYFIDQMPRTDPTATTYCSPVYFASQGPYWYNSPMVAQPPPPSTPTFYPSPPIPIQNSPMFVQTDPTRIDGAGKQYGCPLYIVPQPYLSSPHTPAVSPMLPQEAHSSPNTLSVPTEHYHLAHQQDNNQFPSLNEYGLPQDVSNFGMDLLNDDPDFSKVFNNL